jgi:signal peptidase I
MVTDEKANSPDNNNASDGGNGGGSDENPSTEGARGFIRDTLVPILVVIAIVVPLRSAIADWNDVPSGSMRPTILEGDRIWVNKLAYGLRVPLTMAWIARWDSPSRGEVVTFASPDDGIRLVKRIIGLPGDRISMTANRLTLNGESLSYDEVTLGLPAPRASDRKTSPIVQTERLDDHPHAVTVIPTLAGYSDSFPEFTVPEGHYFFLGDNRDQSRDSRFIGTVALDDIYGRVTHVALSLDPEHYYKPRFARWGMSLDPDVAQ